MGSAPARGEEGSNLDAELRPFGFVPLRVVDEVKCIPFDPEAANMIFARLGAL